jgi:hypothetical protein
MKVIADGGREGENLLRLSDIEEDREKEDVVTPIAV